MVLVLPALTDYRWCFESLLVHSGVSSATRRKATGANHKKEARLLLFGRNHCEVDLKGSFYELIRRLGLHYLPDHIPLPAIDDLRAMLSRDPYIAAVKRFARILSSNSP